MKISRRTAVATIGTSLLLPFSATKLESGQKPEVPDVGIRHLGRHKKHANLPKIRAMMHLMDLGMTADEWGEFRRQEDFHAQDEGDDLGMLDYPFHFVKWGGWFWEKNQSRNWIADDGAVWTPPYVWMSLCCTAVRTHDMIGWLNGEEATTPEERYERLLRGVR